MHIVLAKLSLLTLVSLASLLALLATPKEAKAASLRVACEVYTENRVDPIAFSEHLHRQFGNLSTTNESTADSLYASKDTSCGADGGQWWTNAGWFPEERNEAAPSAIIYYRAPGDQSQIVNIPHGLELIGKSDPSNSASFEELLYNCGASPGDTAPRQATPPYGCTQNWATHLTFPRCWDGIGTEHTDVTYGPNRTTCPDTHPYMLPEINYLIRHPNRDGVVPNPLEVSMGVDEWGDYSMMHADYFFAAQDEFNHDVDLDGDGTIEHTDGGYSEKALIDLCLRQAPDALEFNNARCRTGGLMPWHVASINRYYKLP